VSRDPGVPNARPARVRPRGDTWGGCARNHRRDSTVRQAPNLSRPVAAFSVDRSGRTNWCRHVFVDPTVRRPRLSAECRVPSAECECRMPRARARARAACRVPSAECECRMPHAACACACACRVPSAECRVPRATCHVPSAECGVRSAACERECEAECPAQDPARPHERSRSTSDRRNQPSNERCSSDEPTPTSPDTLTECARNHRAVSRVLEPSPPASTPRTRARRSAATCGAQRFE